MGSGLHSYDLINLNCCLTPNTAALVRASIYEIGGTHAFSLRHAVKLEVLFSFMAL